ncbi:tandem-95 repeat protein [Algibacter amylolyticus]|uniref:Tandem-95 repeat protein n=1 Tax=Algibacter amylolyticus TaxID=1608400 RepID=A0A5M7ATJ1_9FLAO|nr:Ig-like domain-containing protein [Algibacter amylolyticus]KAA5820886.1 tandem-95 repeat protein [Algibacter amylolyticus]MBB5269870.1 endonuclease I/uncharacterized Zn-binding protein involved in type VI secretion [Algibacter amylolyticus]TSJ71961.1 tandem-95 repeat protein [Algibacter amylolyticus]
MKNFSLVLLIVTLIFNYSCSGGDDTPEPKPEPIANGVSIAVNDNLITIENAPFIIKDILSNDTVLDNAKITSFDATSANGGTITDNRDNTYTYTPVDGFLGEDNFKYTICDRDTPPDCSTATVTITVTDEGNPVAVDDAVNVDENTSKIISDLLENDDTIDDAILTTIDDSNTLGTVILNTNRTVTYTPPMDFKGEDSFTYTICDDDLPDNSCSTATVIITVADEGNPVAKDDVINVLENSTKIITSLLENDVVIDGAVLASVDDSTTLGTVVLNSDGTVSYTPQAGYTGEDTFSYTICDNDTPVNSCDSAEVTVSVISSITFNIPSELSDYYSGVIFSDNEDLMFNEISEHTQAMHAVILSYTQRHDHLYNADADLSNQDNVILMYTGESRYWQEYTSGNNPYATQTFNTEHIFPQSKLSSDIAVSDLHHLRSADATVNSDRSNYPFIDGSGTNKLIGGTAWYPGDEWRGDVARMVMYLNIRYGEDFNKVGGLELFKAWNVADPVSEFEEQRNNVIYAAQGNRNPFIDNPYIATLIWGGTAAENKWE